VGGIGAPEEDGRNRSSRRRWKEYRLLQKEKGIESPAEGGRNRNSSIRREE
jgi:hypothetical protein